MKISKLLFHFFLITALAFINTESYAFQLSEDSGKNIKIGFLITDKKSLAAKQGAELAVRHANEKGGFNGHPFEIVVRTMEGPWGTGSKQAVSLIFDEKVCAILGSHDGRNAHLVEQVAVKAQIVFLSAWATDPTLSQAFVPWYFSCVPNDLQQADIFFEEIYNKRKLQNVVVVADSTYDSSLSLKSFLKKTRNAGKTEPLQIFYKVTYPDFDETVRKIQDSNADCLVLFCQPSSSLDILNHIHSLKMGITVFGSISMIGENEINEQKLYDFDNVVFSSSGYFLNPLSTGFIREYQKSYGKIPGPVSAYAYDGMNLILQAIRNGGSNRDNIQKSLAGIIVEGVTGTIQFDTKGNRLNSGGVMEIKNGIPVPAGK